MQQQLGRKPAASCCSWTQLPAGVLNAMHMCCVAETRTGPTKHATLLLHCAGVALAMFPSGTSLPALKSVRLPQPAARGSSADGLDARSPFMSSGAAAALRAARDNSSSAGIGSTSAVGAGGLPFGRGSLDNLAACCPHLAQLWLTAAVSTDVDLAPLRQLTALTELQLGGVVVDDAVSKQVLCGVSQLQRLDLVQCPRFTDAGLAYLTALTELTSLQVRVGPGQGLVFTWCGSFVAVRCAGYRAVCVAAAPADLLLLLLHFQIVGARGV